MEKRRDPKTGRKYTVERTVKKKRPAKNLAAELLVLGMSTRKTAKATNLSIGTIAAIRRKIKADILPCQCGKPSGHRGWCSHRFKNSPVRQATMALMLEKQMQAKG